MALFADAQKKGTERVENDKIKKRGGAEGGMKRTKREFRGRDRNRVWHIRFG